WRVAGEDLVLFGSDPLNVLFAVYSMLENHCGCRWLSEFEGGEIIPRLETVELPAEPRCFSPAFSHRAFTNYPAIDARTVAMIDWMAKHRFNRFMIFANMSGSLEAYDKLLRRELVARGMRIEMGHHSFRFFLPPEEFFAEHPEYYALVSGERVSSGQVCTANPAVAEIMAARVCAFLAAHPEIDTVGLWPNDGYRWCECEACLAQEPQEPSWPYAEHPRRTDTYLRFVNRLAAIVAREHPDRSLSALAYVNYVQPPREVVPLPNVKVCFAPFQRCFKHPLTGAEDDDRCTRPNAEYARLLKQWRALVPGQLYLFEYLMLIDMLSIPYPVTNLLPLDFEHYADLGVSGYVLEFKPEEWGAFGVNANLIGWLSWDARRNTEKPLSVLYADLYGPAAAEMSAYFECLKRDFVRPGPCVHHYDLDYTRRATPLLMRPALEHLGRAVALAAFAEWSQRENVKQAQIGAQWLLRVGQWRGQLAAGEALIDWARAHGKSGALDVEYVERRVRAEL
ncbi:MAG: DUF4838 domain-containing protein, partial [Armatimonadota bacterium]